MPGTIAAGPLALLLRKGGAPGILGRGMAGVAGSLSAAGTYAYTLTPTVGGTIYSRPAFTITLPSDIDYGISEIRIANTSVSPSVQITITRTFAPGDVLIVNSDTYAVTVNGVAVDFEGGFPLLDPRAGTTNSIVIYAVAQTAPTLSPIIDWVPRFAA